MSQDPAELLTVDNFKEYAGVIGDTDNALITRLITRAKKSLEGYTRNPVDITTYTERYTVEGDVLILKHLPIDSETSIVVTDTRCSSDEDEWEVIESDRYEVSHQEGRIVRTGRFGWFDDYGRGQASRRNSRRRRSANRWGYGQRRWQVSYAAGLAAHEDWDSFVCGELEGTMEDLVMFWFENRDPGIMSESLGGGVSRNLGMQKQIPDRIEVVWEQYRPIQI